ncbi:hypothetical protein BC941DRAFT_342457, partial [Chlamydoabsidia padenii]
TLRLTFDASQPTYEDMRVYVEPVSPEEEKQMDEGLDDDSDFDYYQHLGGDQATMYRLYTNSYLNGKKIDGPVAVNAQSDTWDICYKLEEETELSKDDIATKIRNIRRTQATIFLPQSDKSPSFLLKFKEKRVPFHQKKNSASDQKSDNDE